MIVYASFLLDDLDALFVGLVRADKSAEESLENACWDCPCWSV